MARDPSSALMVYVTAPDRETANRISESLLTERLAACTNLFPGVESRYHWQGRIETSTECVLLVKSDEDKFERLRERIKGLHPYEVPCIVAWPLEKGDPAYLRWLKGSL